ncbi:NADPH-dependent FMN reductase [Brevibacillus brevis]|uniref:NAD(P)H-dependent oxidoreductase n=1 Tax=Brevibacillus brevis TaxID=1393 RepID=A0A517IDQ9_BREBE|nr:NADPH-dependent FMN reductase [Brevibacillus brevis]QDS37017.1 NAD(P)H-dependent oxidoreductase [Brevibacillus brevis]
MSTSSLKIGIILGSSRPGRVSPQVGAWLKGVADQRGDAAYEIVDIADFHLPFFGDPNGEQPVAAWAAKLSSLDGFVFVTAEYNHSITGVLKNALDLARKEWYNKAAGIVSYGSSGGTRAAEHLRGILGELQVADVRTQPAFNLFTDFENYTVFKPSELHIPHVNDMLNQVISWSTALQSVRD